MESYNHLKSKNLQTFEDANTDVKNRVYNPNALAHLSKSSETPRKYIQIKDQARSPDTPKIQNAKNINNVPTQRYVSTYLPVVEEPICVLKIELDGQNVEEIRVFENDDPNEIVDKFGQQFNLSNNAR